MEKNNMSFRKNTSLKPRNFKYWKRYFLVGDLVVKFLVFFHFIELTHKYSELRGEQHDFWELIYVENGELEEYNGLESQVLKKGDMFLIKPGELHVARAINYTAPTCFTIGFGCDPSNMFGFTGKVLPISEEAHRILARIIAEGRKTFNPPIDRFSMLPLSNNISAQFGSNQLIKNYLEILLIEIIRNEKEKISSPCTTMLANRHKDLAESIIDYMYEHIKENLDATHISKQYSHSRNYLTVLFKKYTGYGLKEYFNKMKINYAKQMIREENFNISEISSILSYNNVNYFSSQFKKIVGMPPTVYAQSLKARSHLKSKTTFE
jgi:AraC-like DNA-binding protein